MLVLNKTELEVQAGLGLIGIGLPDEYIIRVCKLDKLIKEKGLANITVSDSVDIISESASEIALRKEPSPIKDSSEKI